MHPSRGNIVVTEKKPVIKLPETIKRMLDEEKDFGVTKDRPEVTENKNVFCKVTGSSIGARNLTHH